MEASISPADLEPWPAAPATATFGPLPDLQHATVSTPSPQPLALNHTDLPRIQTPVQGSPTPIGAISGPGTTAPPLPGGTSYPVNGTLDHMAPSLDNVTHSHTPERTPMVPEGSSSNDHLDGYKGNFSKSASELDPVNAAPGLRAASAWDRSAKVAPVRLFSKAAIYPYASQGLSCQGADSRVLSSTTGGPTYCLDIRGSSINDAVEVCLPCPTHPAYQMTKSMY